MPLTFYFRDKPVDENFYSMISRGMNIIHSVQIAQIAQGGL